MAAYIVSWEAKAQHIQVGKYTWCILRAATLFQKAVLQFSFLFPLRIFYKVLGIKYGIKSLLHVSHFSTTKLSLQTEFLYFNDSMTSTRVDLLSYWKLSTKILGVSKGLFRKQNFPDKVII